MNKVAFWKTELAFPNVKSYYKSIVIKIECHWLSERQIGNWISIFKTYSTT